LASAPDTIAKPTAIVSSNTARDRARTRLKNALSLENIASIGFKSELCVGKNFIVQPRASISSRALEL
jgi:hypothetical protein